MSFASRPPHYRTGQATHNRITSFLWGITDDTMGNRTTRLSEQKLRADFETYQEGFSDTGLGEPEPPLQIPVNGCRACDIAWLVQCGHCLACVQVTIQV
jgi:hypothetical protein